MTDRPAGPQRCTVRVAGHAVHPTRLRRHLDQGGGAGEPVVVLGAVGDVVVLGRGAELWRYRNHDPGRLVALAAVPGCRALLDVRHGLLVVRRGPQDAGSVFSLQPADHLPHPCAAG
ncbi:hypothetical protein [Geodermatophilus sp. DSM 44513]|uniref:hypothetical protein n=1 Tax=Geodermatophilus sp. DSM 44513 TaxID=1528104 RepID=UPI00128319DF|nr:hypothetical protein [Geodermatophilus sp. DSM 44513]WNV74107.1 hypothetical protein RTG05_14040 [Geodermatophilus sp. DSM 44513]